MGCVRREIPEDFVVVVIVVVFLCLFFRAYFVEFLAVFNCREVFWKKGDSEDF